MIACEHDWRTGPVVGLHGETSAICVKCWRPRTLSWDDASVWPAWTENDYWNNLDAIEGDRAPEIRRLQDTP